MDTAVLERANHFQTGAVADVAETFVGVAAEGALENRAVIRAVEKRAPLLEFADTVGSFLRVKLRHAPVVEEFAAAHGVPEMWLPTVGGVNVGHGCGDAAFGHDGVGLSKKRFANDADARALRESFNRGAQSCAAGANDKNVVLAGLVASGHRILRSWIAPLATRRT